MKARWVARIFSIALVFGVAAVASRAQDTQQDTGQAGGGAAVPRTRQPEPEPRPYERVITKDAKTQTGVFTVHQIKDKFYYEIPNSELNKDFLWVSTIAKTTLGVGYGGQADGNHVVRWERHGNHIFLRSVSYEIVADESLPIYQAVQAANSDAIWMSFPVEAFGPNDTAVIDVSRLFTSEVPEISARARLRARAFDPQRAFIERVSAFPENVEVEATQTYTTPIDPAPAGGRGEPTPGGRGAPQGMRPGSATVLMHYSMVKLPENKMMPRIFDERVGYFTVEQQDFGRDEHRAPKRTYITRWRLEKKDPNAAMSEPVKPIVYYVDPATPMKWRPWIKRAIEDWQPAFEAAGFKNAIIAKDPPTDDPSWSPEDVRNSVVRWLPSTTENAVGPNIHDPRTGEILNADIQLYQNVMNLAQDWYFVQVGPLDPRAAKLPLPDDLEGRLIEYVVAHEVGHTLGFQHNMKSSSLYPIEKIRDAQWLHTMGHVATLMDYSRFNYVAQPEDHVAPEDLIPRIGPYDIWATHWGYAPIPGAKTADDEKATLDKWTRDQDAKPYLRFSTEHSNGSDPGENTEAVGDADAIYATGMGVKNLHRVMGMLVAATAEPGHNYDDLSEVYGRVLGQWVLEMNHVAVIVGGIESQDKHAEQAGPQFTPTSRERQVAAVKYLDENAFHTPTFLIQPQISRLFEPSGVMDRVRTSQMSVLNRLLDARRIDRLVEIEAEDGAKAYKTTEFMADVRGGVFTELSAPSVRIDAYRRNLQRGYVELLAERINARTAAQDDSRALFRGELKALSAQVSAAIPKAGDAETKFHLEDVKDSIARALDPKFAYPEPTGAAGAGAGRGGVVIPNAFEADPESLGCWPDYKIDHR